MLQCLVEFDGQGWEKREWLAVHKSFQVLLVESGLVWVTPPATPQKDTPTPEEAALTDNLTSTTAALVSPDPKRCWLLWKK